MPAFDPRFPGPAPRDPEPPTGAQALRDREADVEVLARASLVRRGVEATRQVHA